MTRWTGECLLFVWPSKEILLSLGSSNGGSFFRDQLLEDTSISLGSHAWVVDTSHSIYKLILGNVRLTLDKLGTGFFRWGSIAVLFSRHQCRESKIGERVPGSSWKTLDTNAGWGPGEVYIANWCMHVHWIGTNGGDRLGLLVSWALVWFSQPCDAAVQRWFRINLISKSSDSHVCSHEWR